MILSVISLQSCVDNSIIYFAVSKMGGGVHSYCEFTAFDASRQ